MKHLLILFGSVGILVAVLAGIKTLDPSGHSKANKQPETVSTKGLQFPIPEYQFVKNTEPRINHVAEENGYKNSVNERYQIEISSDVIPYDPTPDSAEIEATGEFSDQVNLGVSICSNDCADDWDESMVAIGEQSEQINIELVSDDQLEEVPDYSHPSTVTGVIVDSPRLRD